MLRLVAGLLSLVGLAWLTGCDSSEPYQRRNGRWVFDEQPLGDGRIDQLTVLNRRFAKTTTQVFYRHTPIDEADPATFEALDEHHARDRLRVYHADTYRVSQDYFTTQRIRVRIVPGAEAASFRLLDQGYARDRQHLYFEGEAFAVSDVEGFEVLAYGFARDRHSGYYLRTPVKGSQGASFEVLSPHYAKDAQQVFHADLDYHQSGPPPVRARRMAGVDLASFRVLDGSYALDASRVYWAGDVVKDAEAASFMLLSPPTELSDARDARRQYLRGRPVAF